MEGPETGPLASCRAAWGRNLGIALPQALQIIQKKGEPSAD